MGSVTLHPIRTLGLLLTSFVCLRNYYDMEEKHKMRKSRIKKKRKGKSTQYLIGIKTFTKNGLRACFLYGTAYKYFCVVAHQH